MQAERELLGGRLEARDIARDGDCLDARDEGSESLGDEEASAQPFDV